jgi:hypothetical protein
MHAQDVSHTASVAVCSLLGNAAAEHISPWVPDMPGAIKSTAKAGIQDPQDEICFLSSIDCLIKNVPVDGFPAQEQGRAKRSSKDIDW